MSKIFLIPTGIFLSSLVVFNVAQAANDLYFTPQISIPGSDFQSQQQILIKNDTSLICDYIIAVYKYAIAIVGVLAVVSIAIGGTIWILSSGSSSMVGTAKDWIFSGLIGLILALGSFMLLATINKDLVTCQISSVQDIAKINQTPQPTTTGNNPNNTPNNNNPIKDTSKDFAKYFGCCTLSSGSSQTLTEKTCTENGGSWQADSFVENNKCVKGANCCVGDDMNHWSLFGKPTFNIMIPTNATSDKDCKQPASFSAKINYWDLVKSPCSSIVASVTP